MSQSPSKSFRKKTTRRKSRRSPQGSTSSGTEIEITRYGVGLDVHKENIVVSVAAQTEQNLIVQIRTHKFRNHPPGLQELTQFLQKYQPVSHYLMECTGIYHRPLYHALEGAFPNSKTKIIAMNPLLVHRKLTDLGNKHDKADAQGMAELSFYDRLIRPSYVGTPEFFHLRDTLRNYKHAKKEASKHVNRIHRVLCSVNFMCKLNLHHEWELHLLDYIIATEGPIKRAFKAMVESSRLEKRSISSLMKHQEDFVPYFNIELPKSSRFNLRQLVIQYLQAETNAAQYLLQTEKQILKDAEFEHWYLQLLRIPCVGQISALRLITELGDFRRFVNWKAFAKYCGVVPEIKESGGTFTASHINRFTNAHLRTALSQVAMLYVNGYAKGTDLSIFAHRQRVLRRLPYKKAVMRVAHKLSRIIYQVLVNNVTYDVTYEQTKAKIQRLQRKNTKHGTMLESSQTRSLQRDISQLLVTNSQYMTSKSRFFLVKGFQQLIRKANVVELEGTKLDSKKNKI